MSRIPARRRPDPEAAALVRRTLSEVAASLPVPDDDADAPPAPASSDASPPGAPGTAGQRGRLLVAAAVVAIAGLAATGVWAAQRGDGGGTDTGPATRAPEGEGDGVVAPMAGWLPESLESATPVGDDTAAAEPPPQAILARGPAPDDVMVVADVPGAADQAVRVGDAVGRVLGARPYPDGSYSLRSTTAATGTRTVVTGPFADVPTEALVAAVNGGGALDATAPPGWEAEPLDLGWVPGIGTTRSTRYDTTLVDQPVSLRLGVVAGALPGPVLDALLPAADAVTVRGATGRSVPASAVEGRDPGAGDLVIWQEAPGVVGFVEAHVAVDSGVLVRVADEATWPTEVRLDATAGTAGATDRERACGVGATEATLPGEEAGEVITNAVGVSGADDIPYELVLWDGADGAPDGGCWRLAVDGGPPVRGTAGDWPAERPYGAITPVAWTDVETVLFVAHAAGTQFVAEGAALSSQGGDRGAGGTAYTFLRVERDDRPTVVLTPIDPTGAALDPTEPIPLDRPGG